jgi:hypothetical protein
MLQHDWIATGCTPGRLDVYSVVFPLQKSRYPVIIYLSICLFTSRFNIAIFTLSFSHVSFVEIRISSHRTSLKRDSMDVGFLLYRFREIRKSGTYKKPVKFNGEIRVSPWMTKMIFLIPYPMVDPRSSIGVSFGFASCAIVHRICEPIEIHRPRRQFHKLIH